jgi:hypothetical protein
MYVPVFGPWLALKHVDLTGYKALLVMDGGVQAAGAVLVIGGLLTAGEQLVRSKPSAPLVTVVPHVSPHGGGVGAFGRF